VSVNGAGTPILEVGDIHTYYGSIQALKGISLTVNDGEIVTLLGANGAGKTTTLRSINGLNRPRQGTIRFQGKDITTPPPHQIVKRGIAQSPEGRRLFPRMSVTENLEMGAFQRNDRAEIRADMDRVFELFPRLHERRTQKAGTMSGGEQQMCAIGRALMARPKLLLLDEPSLGLAPIFVERIFEIIHTINQEGTSILLVEQNALMALDAAHRHLGARFAPFGGWDMPLQYSGVLEEHRACRENAVVFDVSHLGTLRCAGGGVFDALQWALTNDLRRIAPGRAQYTHLLDEIDAHVVDDLIVWWLGASPNELLVMPNASNTGPLVAALRDACRRFGSAGDTVEDVTEQRAVLAVQGPQARNLLKPIAPEAAEGARFHVRPFSWRGAECVAAGTMPVGGAESPDRRSRRSAEGRPDADSSDDEHPDEEGQTDNDRGRTDLNQEPAADEDGERPHEQLPGVADEEVVEEATEALDVPHRLARLRPLATPTPCAEGLPRRPDRRQRGRDVARQQDRDGHIACGPLHADPFAGPECAEADQHHPDRPLEAVLGHPRQGPMDEDPDDEDEPAGERGSQCGGPQVSGVRAEGDHDEGNLKAFEQDALERDRE